MVKNTYKNITKDEKINLYLKLVDYLNYKEENPLLLQRQSHFPLENKEDVSDEKRSHLCETECRQERQREH